MPTETEYSLTIDPANNDALEMWEEDQVAIRGKSLTVTSLNLNQDALRKLCHLAQTHEGDLTLDFSPYLRNISYTQAPNGPNQDDVFDVLCRIITYGDSPLYVTNFSEFGDLALKKASVLLKALAHRTLPITLLGKLQFETTNIHNPLSEAIHHHLTRLAFPESRLPAPLLPKRAKNFDDLIEQLRLALINSPPHKNTAEVCNFTRHLQKIVEGKDTPSHKLLAAKLLKKEYTPLFALNNTQKLWRLWLKILALIRHPQNQEKRKHFKKIRQTDSKSVFFRPSHPSKTAFHEIKEALQPSLTR